MSRRIKLILPTHQVCKHLESAEQPRIWGDFRVVALLVGLNSIGIFFDEVVLHAVSPDGGSPTVGLRQWAVHRRPGDADHSLQLTRNSQVAVL